MNIKTISANQYNEFAIKLNKDHFLHSVPWANTRVKIGWSYEIIGLFDNDKLLAAAIIMFKKFPYINKYYTYTSRGFIIDYSNYDLLNKWSNELKRYLSNKKVVSLTIDPDIILNTLNDNYEIIEHFDKSNLAMENLSKAKFVHQGFWNNFEGIQPRHTFRIDTQNNSKEELYKKMHRSTRYSVNLVSKSHLDVTYKSKDNLDEFMELMEETTKRDGFTSRDIKYYQNIMEEFGDNIKLIFVSINPNKISSIHKEELEHINNQINDLKDGKELEELGKKAKTKVNELIKQQDKIQEKIKKLKPYLKYDKLNLATAFLLTYNNKAWYVYGASSDHLREYRPTYLIYKTMIDYCYENKIQFLDLFGVGGELNPNSHIHGLYVIKKGFGGDLVEFIGEYDLVINKFYYSLFKTMFPKLKSLRKKLKR